MTREEKLEYLRSLPGEMISPKQLSVVTGGRPYYYNQSAKEGKLHLPHEWHGRNLRIWKQPVIRMIEGVRFSARPLTDEEFNDLRVRIERVHHGENTNIQSC